MKHFAVFSSDTYEYNRGVFFHLGYILFSGMFFFNLSQPWILWRKQTLFLPIRRRNKNKKQKSETNKNDSSTSNTYVWYVCIYIFMYTLTYTSWSNYNNTQCCCMQWVHKKKRFSILYCCVRVHTRLCMYPVQKKKYHTCFSTTNSSISSINSATAASFVCCCLPYVVYSSIDSSVLVLLNLNCIRVR